MEKQTLDGHKINGRQTAIIHHKSTQTKIQDPSTSCTGGCTMTGITRYQGMTSMKFALAISSAIKNQSKDYIVACIIELDCIQYIHIH